MPVDEETTHIPIIEDVEESVLPNVPDAVDFGLSEVTEDPTETPEPSPATLQPLGLKDVLRVVVFGGCKRLGGHVALSAEFTRKPAGSVIDPDSHFEAGIAAASADILIFDMVNVEFGIMLELLSTVEEYVPRAVVVALLEPGDSPGTLPECGIHLAIPEPFTAESVAKGIEHLMFGP